MAINQNKIAAIGEKLVKFEALIGQIHTLFLNNDGKIDEKENKKLARLEGGISLIRTHLNIATTAATTPPPSTPDSKPTPDAQGNIKVPKGWGIDKIAREYGITADQLKAWNQDKLQSYGGFSVGATIRVKAIAAATHTQPKTPSDDVPKPNSDGKIKVPAGWGLYRLATTYDVTQQELESWNRDKLQSYGFNAGAMIIVVAGKTSGNTTTETTTTTPAGARIKPAWLVEAYKHVGKKEKDPSKTVEHDPFLKELFMDQGKVYNEWAKDRVTRDTHWCAAFVSYCLRKGGKTALKDYDGIRAKSYAKYGTEITEPIYGCIAVINRGGGGHVGFVVGKEGDHIKLLGGNQGGKSEVSVITEKRKIIAFVKPTGWNPPSGNNL